LRNSLQAFRAWKLVTVVVRLWGGVQHLAGTKDLALYNRRFLLFRFF
jgi:hypothetical protein